MGRTSNAKENLIRTVYRLVWEESYRSVGVQEICKRAGVKPGSFYHFFESKEALTLAAIDLHWHEISRLVLDPVARRVADPLERIAAVFEREYELFLKTKKRGKRILGCPIGSLVGELGEGDDAIRIRCEQVLNRVRDYFLAALREGVVQGKIAGSAAKLKQKSETLLTLYQGALLMARARNSAESIKQAARTAREIVAQ